MNDNNGNASSREDPNRHSPERGASNEPPVKKKKTETNKMSVATSRILDIDQLLFDIKAGKNVTTCDRDGRNAMHYAAEFNRLDVAEAIVKNPNCHSLINSLNKKGESPVIVAAKQSHEHIVTYLLVSGAKFEIGDEYGMTLLHLATEKGWLDIVKDVVRKGYDINTLTPKRETALLLAAKFSFKEIVKALIDLGANVHCCDSKGWNLLHYASSYGWLDVVQCVVHKNADANSKTVLSETPLLIAAKNSFKDIVTFLISSGVKFNCFDKFKRSMLSYSSKNGWLDLLVYGVQMGMDLNAETNGHFTALRYAVVHGKIDVVSYLISEGVNFYFCDKKGWTILHHAAARGWYDIAQCVLKSVDINARSFLFSTPLLLAAIKFQKEVATLLIDAGADVNCADRFNRTILHHAAKNGWLDVALSALERGAYIDSLCVHNETPLLTAARHFQPDIACLFSVFGANVNLFDRQEKAVLHYASERGWLDVVKAVIQNDPDLNVMNSTYDTPLHLTCMFKQLRVMKCLLEAGADHNKKAPGGKYMTPFNYAVRINFIRNSRTMVKAIALFIENGAFPQTDDSVFIFENPMLKEGLLRDKKLCVRAYLNKFNNYDLPRLYALPIVNVLPPIDHVRIGKNHKVIKEIERMVQGVMDRHDGYCDLNRIYFRQPCSLSMSVIRVLIAACFRYISVY